MSVILSNPILPLNKRFLSPVVGELEQKSPKAVICARNLSFLSLAVKKNNCSLPYLAQISRKLSDFSRLSTKAQSSSTGNGSTMEEKEEEDDEGTKQLKLFIQGRDEVNKVLQTMADVLDDLGKDGKKEEEAIELSSQLAVEAHLDSLNGSFLMAIDVEIKNAESDSLRKRILVAVKEEVLTQLAAQFPPQVRVVSILSATPKKEVRKNILCQAVAGGGVFKTVEGKDLEVPAVKLDDVIRQSDNLVSLMEEKEAISDRKLLSRLVLVREEARTLLGGGIHDPRSDPTNFRNVPQSHVDFMTSIMALSGKYLRSRLADVMNGKAEGADIVASDRRVREGSSDEAKVAVDELTVRPGSLLDSLARVTKEMLTSGQSRGYQHLQWTRQEVLAVLQDIAHPKE